MKRIEKRRDKKFKKEREKEMDWGNVEKKVLEEKGGREIIIKGRVR